MEINWLVNCSVSVFLFSFVWGMCMTVCAYTLMHIPTCMFLSLRSVVGHAGHFLACIFCTGPSTNVDFSICDILNWPWLSFQIGNKNFILFFFDYLNSGITMNLESCVSSVGTIVLHEPNTSFSVYVPYSFSLGTLLKTIPTSGISSLNLSRVSSRVFLGITVLSKY